MDVFEKKERIKETIVVEGKDDEAALKRAVDCEVIITRGFGMTEETLLRIAHAAETTGIIVFTDPDFAGERIRERIVKRVPSCKHAFLSKEDAMLKDNIGIENASPESIIEALGKVRTIRKDTDLRFTKQDLFMLELEGFEHSAEKRNQLGKALGIGYCNAKQFLNRLNHYGVTREEFMEAITKLGLL